MKTFFTFWLTLCCVSIFAQNIAEDADGNGSILFPVGNLSFNTTDAQLKIGYVHGVPSGTAYIKQIDTNKIFKPKKISRMDSLVMSSRWIYGAFATAKNDDGLGSMFEDGKFTSNTGITAMVGFKFYGKSNTYRSYATYTDARKTLDSTKSAHDKLMKEVDEASADVLSMAEEERKRLKKEGGADTALFDTIITYARLQVDAASLDGIDRLNGKILKMAEEGKKTPNLQSHSDRVLSNIIKQLKDQSAKSQSMRALHSKLPGLKTTEYAALKALSNEGLGLNYFTFYLKGDLERRAFTRYQPQFSAPDSMYTDSSFTGLGISANLNYFMPRKHWAFGLSGGYRLVDNYDTLASVKVNVTKIIYQDSLRTDKTVKDVTAVKGDYYTYHMIPIMFDAVWMAPNRENTMVVAAGGYFRYNYAVPQAERTIRSSWNIGATLSIFKPEKGLFIGGLYLQYGGFVNGSAKPKEMVSFGITTKLNLIRFDYTRIFPDSE